MTRRILETVLAFGALLGGLCIWLICGIVTYDVIMRYLGSPTLWALEISTYLMIGTATLGSGLAVIRGDHFAVDILPMFLPEGPRKWLQLATSLICLALLAFVTYGFWKLIALSLKLDMKSSTLLHVPTVYPQSIVFTGFALMVLAFVYKLFFRKD